MDAVVVGEVDKENDRMGKYNVWDIVPKAHLLLKTKILESLCVMKPKPDKEGWDGDFQTHLGPENDMDIFTKNVDAGSLHRHSAKLCGNYGLLGMLKGEKP